MTQAKKPTGASAKPAPPKAAPVPEMEPEPAPMPDASPTALLYLDTGGTVTAVFANNVTMEGFLNRIQEPTRRFVAVKVPDESTVLVGIAHITLIEPTWVPDA